MPVRPRQLAEELPALLVVRSGRSELSSCSRVQKIARSAPMLNPSGSNIAPWSWLPSRVIVQVSMTRSMHSRGFGPVADDVAQAEDLGDPLGLDVVEDDFQGFEVPVNIADQSSTHRGETSDHSIPMATETDDP